MDTDQPNVRSIVRFGVFEVDLLSGELRRNGVKIKVQDQPFQVLEMLLARPGELVTREELQKKLWRESTFVDFEHGLNAAIKRLREALGDDADNPRFVETLHRRGYRFIYPVPAATSPPTDVGAHSGAPAVAPVSPPAVSAAGTPIASGQAPPLQPVGAIRESPLRKRWIVAAIVGAVVAIVAIVLAINLAGLRERMMTAVGARRAVPLSKIDSIAVLPLENLSGDPEQEYFADGMTEELITTLGKISALRVISRTSVMHFKGARPAGGLAEIAQKLKVDAVVEGSVMRSGDRVRITANLLDARSERHLWAEAYDRDLHDVLALQGEVARAIADEVKAKLTPDVQARLTNARPVNPEALEFYLKGTDSLDHDDPKTALQYFQHAIQKDPDFARAYFGAAWSQNQLYWSDDQAFEKGKAYSRKALQLDDSLAEAHSTLAYSLWNGDWDWAGAEREWKRALEVNPNSYVAHYAYADYLSSRGRPEQAIAEARRSVEISPLSGDPHAVMGFAYLFARRYDEALVEFEKAKSLGLQQNSSLFTPFALGCAYREKGMYKEALAQFQQLPDGPIKFGPGGNCYARAGNEAEARKAIRHLVERETKDPDSRYALALVYAGLGEKDRAFEWLEKAYKAHDNGMLYLKVDPPLDPLRSDPRFQDLLRRMNFPP